MTYQSATAELSLSMKWHWQHWLMHTADEPEYKCEMVLLYATEPLVRLVSTYQENTGNNINIGDKIKIMPSYCTTGNFE